jgi:hypothetical protein
MKLALVGVRPLLGKNSGDMAGNGEDEEEES